MSSDNEQKAPLSHWALSRRTRMGTVREDYSADGDAWRYFR